MKAEAKAVAGVAAAKVRPSVVEGVAEARCWEYLQQRHPEVLELRERRAQRLAGAETHEDVAVQPVPKKGPDPVASKREEQLWLQWVRTVSEGTLDQSPRKQFEAVVDAAVEAAMIKSNSDEPVVDAAVD